MAKQTILIIEDDLQMAKLQQEAFEEAGFVVLHASSGRGGLELAQKEQPTVILLDVIIPDMTGWDVMQELQKDPKTKTIPVVVDTNLASASREMDFMQAGAKAFLVKADNDLQAIVKKVQEILKK